MGLDFSICASIYKKSNHERVWHDELCYWRKCYALTKRIMDIAFASNSLLSTEEYREEITFYDDYYARCKADPEFENILTEVIGAICEAITDPNAEIWRDSIWGASDTRVQTIKCLEKLCALQSFILSKGRDSDALMRYLFLDTLFTQIAENPDDYVFEIEFYNSY